MFHIYFFDKTEWNAVFILHMIFISLSHLKMRFIRIFIFFMLKDKVESVSYDYELNMSDRFFINILNFFLLFHIEDNF